MKHYTHSCILTKSEFLNFDFDMIRHIKSQMLQKIELANTHQSDYIHLIYSGSGEHVTVEGLLNTGFYAYDTLLNFIESLYSLKTLCEEFLLDFDKIDFHPKAIYYDVNNKKYLYRYLPYEHRLNHYSLLDLLQHVGIENKNLFPVNNTFDWLKHSQLTLDQFTDNLKRIKNEPEGKKSPFSYIKNRFKSNPEPIQTSITQHRKHLPTLTNKSNPEETHTLYFDFSTVGRSASNNIFIECSTVSKKHAIIVKEETMYHVQDLNSTNGTYLNGLLLNGRSRIVNGDILQFGDKEFVFLR